MLHAAPDLTTPRGIGQPAAAACEINEAPTYAQDRVAKPSSPAVRAGMVWTFGTVCGAHAWVVLASPLGLRVDAPQEAVDKVLWLQRPERQTRC
jgi:hypothetical protein